MAYFEELLQDFKEGAKLKLSDWEQGEYIWLGNDNQIYWQNNFALDTMELFHLLGKHYTDWEVWQEPIDWHYVIDHKCLCWFWDNDIDDCIVSKLVKISEPADQFQDYKYKWALNGKYWKNCRPVCRGEVTFYEDKKDD